MGETKPPDEGHPRSELSRRLRHAMTEKDLSQSTLAARAGISKAAVNNALNPKKGAPTPHTLGMLAKALGVTGESLHTLRSLRDRADTRTRQHSPQLHGYLDAAARAARQHPFPGMLPGATPPLADVYVGQRLRELPSGAATSAAAEMLLWRMGNCVVESDPGGGKSTLLRTSAAKAISHLLEGRTKSVPLLVSAADLAGRSLLPEAIAASVSAELSEVGLLETLPAELIRTEPYPGARWLLLVDGLDEITDPASRRRVLSKLTASADKGPFRFIVATRQLPDEEFGALDRTVVRFELQPFASRDLRQLAARWFSGLGVPDPEHAAEAFHAALARAHLDGLAHNPLMATMLCQLYAAAQGQALPTGRTEIYQRFLDLLHERQHTAGNSGIRTQTRQALERHGARALALAESMLDHLPALISHLAVERHRGCDRPTMDVLMSQPAAGCPEGIPRTVWADFLTDSLRRSGLLSLRRGELTFLHQTLLEYCAACHTEARAQLLRTIFDKGWGRPWPWTRRIWTPPGGSLRSLWRDHDDSSYLGFLLDLEAENGPDVARNLCRLATHGGLEGAAFIAEQARMGTLISEQTLQAARSTLTSLARDPRANNMHRSVAVKTLVQWGDQRALSAAAAVIADPEVDEIPGRAQALIMVSVGDADALAALAQDPTAPAFARAGAAAALSVANDRRAGATLASVIRDPVNNEAAREFAAHMLDRHRSKRSSRKKTNRARKPPRE